MTDQKIKTTLQYSVDDRALKGLDATLHRAFDEKMLQAFERSLERSARHIEALTKAAGRLEQTMGGRGGGGGHFGGSFFPPSNQPQGGPRGGGGGPPFGGANDMAAAVRDLTRLLGNRGGGPAGGGGGNPMASRLGSTAGGLFSQLGQGGFYQSAVSSIPVVGGVLGGAMGAAGQHYQQYVAQEQARAAAYGALGSGGRTSGRYGRYGLDAGQAATQYGAFAQGAGMTGEELDPRTQGTLLEAQFGAGINGAGLLRAQTTSGGHADNPTRLIQHAITAGMVAGVREARLPEYVEALSSSLDSARMEGADLSAESIEQLVQGLGRMGLGGERAMSLAGSATSNLRHFRPSGNVSSIVALQAAGYGQRGVTYSDAMRRLQETPDQVMENAVRQLRTAGGGNRESIRQLIRSLGPELTGQQLTETDIDALEGGDASQLHGGVGTQEGSDFLSRRGRGARGAASVGSAEAAYRNRSAGVGQSLASSYQSIRNTEMDQVAALLPQIERVAAYLVENLGTLMNGVFQFLGITPPGGGAGGGGATPLSTLAHPIDTMRSAADEAADAMFGARLPDGTREGQTPTSVLSPADRAAARRSGDAPSQHYESGPHAALDLQRLLHQAADAAGRLGEAADGGVATG
jgi:hypothetical protein